MLALLAASACRAAWDLGDAPDRLLDADGSASTATASSGDPGSSSGGGPDASVGGAGGASSSSGEGASTTGGGSSSSGGSGPSGACGTCDDDADCGDVGGDRHCGPDGVCLRATWVLHAGAFSAADRFAVTDDLVAVVIDAGDLDPDDAPGSGNVLSVLDRATGAVSAAPFGLTARGSLTAAPDGTLVYAPRAPDVSDETQLVTVDESGDLTPWPDAPSDLVLGGLRWDASAPGGPAFFAIGSDGAGARLVRFEPGPFAPCDASDELFATHLWAGSEGASRTAIADLDGLTLERATFPLGEDGCDTAAPSIDDVALGSRNVRPIAVAMAAGRAAVVTRGTVETTLVVVDEAGEVVFEAPTQGSALAARGGDFYAMRGGGLSRFSAMSPDDATPVEGLDASDIVVDLVLTNGAIFVVTLDSNDVARLVCVPEG